MLQVMWFRRDLRTHDHPALLAALSESAGSPILPLYVHAESSWSRTAPGSQAHLVGSLGALRQDLGGLEIRNGSPVSVLSQLARESGGIRVHVTAAQSPAGRVRDQLVDAALSQLGSSLVASGTNYAVAPGTVRKADDTPFKVFTPFFRAWQGTGWPKPYGRPTTIPIVPASRPWSPLPLKDSGPLTVAPGEAAARARWRKFASHELPNYETSRDRPDLDLTSRLSNALRWGEIHPRTLLADLTPGRDARFQTEICWREFYADVLLHNPHCQTANLDPEWDYLETDAGIDADEAFDRWASGRTGYPFIDAGMRQLRTEGWMHNRARMAVASFLVKDLHLPWWRGEAEFRRWLIDGDAASNALGWQWVAGTGTDAAPFFRVFNPILQGQKFDPSGDYVRRYVRQLDHVSGSAVHEPWKVAGAMKRGYPERMLDHAQERTEALRRYAAMRSANNVTQPQPNNR